MKTPKEGITKEARLHLLSKLDRMKGRERKKTERRLEMHDRGQKAKKEDEFKVG